MIDELLADIASQGWIVSYCFQYPSGDRWRVVLTKPIAGGDLFTDIAEAPTLAEALEDCASKLAEAEFVESRKLRHSIEPAPVPLLQRLGLAKPIEPIRRRI